MAARDPERRRLAATIASNTYLARVTDRASMTAAARSARLKQFEDEVDPRRELDPDERARRVANLRRAHLAKAALASVKARAARKAAAEQAQADAELDQILVAEVAR